MSADERRRLVAELERLEAAVESFREKLIELRLEAVVARG